MAKSENLKSYFILSLLLFVCFVLVLQQSDLMMLTNWNHDEIWFTFFSNVEYILKEILSPVRSDTFDQTRWQKSPIYGLFYLQQTDLSLSRFTMSKSSKSLLFLNLLMFHYYFNLHINFLCKFSLIIFFVILLFFFFAQKDTLDILRHNPHLHIIKWKFFFFLMYQVAEKSLEILFFKEEFI